MTDKETDASINQSSDNIGSNEQIISDINTLRLEREGLSGSNEDTDQEKTEGCTTLHSCFTMDARSGQSEPLVGTSSNAHNECKFFYFYYLNKSVLFSEHVISSK
jgi:hypothetical protein